MSSLLLTLIISGLILRFCLSSEKHFKEFVSSILWLKKGNAEINAFL